MMKVTLLSYVKDIPGALYKIKLNKNKQKRQKRVQNQKTLTETDTQEHVYQNQLSDVNELKQHLIEMWSATSRASLIKRLISGKIVLMHVLKKKQTLNIC